MTDSRHRICQRYLQTQLTEFQHYVCQVSHASESSKPSFMKSRYFTIAFGIASLVGTGLVGGLFEYIGSRIAANAAADADPFKNPQPDVFSEWMNRKEFMELRAIFESKRKGLTFWDLGYWMEDIEGKVEGGENKFRCKYSDNLDGLNEDQWQLSENRFKKLNDQYASQGFDLFKHHFFEDNPRREVHMQNVLMANQNILCGSIRSSNQSRLIQSRRSNRKKKLLAIFWKGHNLRKQIEIVMGR